MPVEMTSIPFELKVKLAQGALADLPYASEIWSYLFKEAPEAVLEDSIAQTVLQETVWMEQRYRSVDVALQDLEFEQYLEWVSGMTFRALSLCDAPENIVVNIFDPLEESIRSFIQETILPELHAELEGTLIRKGFQGWNHAQMQAVKKSFDLKPTCIISDNFFHRLDNTDQAHMAQLIHELLKRSDGFWVNADVCVHQRNKFSQQLAQESSHSLDDQPKGAFESYSDAAEFFRQQGFLIYDKVRVPASRLHVYKNPSLEPFKRLVQAPLKEYERQTWVLQVL